MNHTSQAQLYTYMSDNPNQLTESELKDYIWLVEQLLQELRQCLIIRRNTPINTPTGSPE